MAKIVDEIDRSKLGYVDVDGIATRYYDSGGDGPPLLLVHGGNPSSIWSLDCWSLNFAGLEEHFRVIALDKFAEGGTDGPAEAEGYTYDNVVGHLVGFMEALELRAAHLVGNSRGGFMTLWLALHRPELVLSDVIINSGTAARPLPGNPNGAYYARLAASLPAGPPTREWIRPQLKALVLKDELVTDAWVDEALRLALLPESVRKRELFDSLGGGFGERIWEPSLGVAQRDVWDRLERQSMAAPTLLVWGREDASVPFQSALELYEMVRERTPTADLHVLGDAHHSAFRDQPDAFNRLITSFCLDR